jgi:hypothetical protein
VELVDLYQKITEISKPICATCIPPYHCCHPVGCGQAMVWARSVYGVQLEYTSDNAISTLPYLTKTGCTVAPHLRPLCSLWLCPEGEAVAPPEYWQLKAKIMGIEIEKGDSCRK